MYGWRKEGRKTKWRLGVDGKHILKYVEAAESKEGPTESESLFTKIYFALTVSIDGHCVHYILCEKCQTKSLASCSALPPRTSNVSVYSTESGLDDTLVRCPTKHDKNIPWLNRGTCNQLYDGAFKFAQTPTTGREARQ